MKKHIHVYLRINYLWVYNLTYYKHFLMKDQCLILFCFSQVPRNSIMTYSMKEERNDFKENKCNVLQRSENLTALGLEREDVP